MGSSKLQKGSSEVKKKTKSISIVKGKNEGPFPCPKIKYEKREFRDLGSTKEYFEQKNSATKPLMTYVNRETGSRNPNMA